MSNQAKNPKLKSRKSDTSLKSLGEAYREPADQLVAIDLGTSFMLPVKPMLSALPGGIYYPMYRHGQDVFALKKVSDNQIHADETMRVIGLERGRNRSRRVYDPALDPDDFGSLSLASLSSMDAASRTQREKYFPMEDYNIGLMTVRENVSRFLENAEFYRSHNLNYKRSILLFGDPGTGKSRMLYEICNELIESHEAIVIKIDTDADLDTIFDHGLIPISQSLGGRFKIILIEELSQLCTTYSDLVKVLHLLDSFIMNENVLFLMSTNHPDRVPNTLTDRPSRIDFISRVRSKDFDKAMILPWYEHLMGKKIQLTSADREWVDAKLSPAYLKELFLLAEINQSSLEESWEVIKDRRSMVKSNFAENDRRMGFDMGAIDRTVGRLSRDLFDRDSDFKHLDDDPEFEEMMRKIDAEIAEEDELKAQEYEEFLEWKREKERRERLQEQEQEQEQEQ
jgi:DNA replication protein DnaC